jgi:hypothetical protein
VFGSRQAKNVEDQDKLLLVTMEYSCIYAIISSFLRNCPIIVEIVDIAGRKRQVT